MATNTGGFATLLAPGLFKVFFNEIDHQPNQWLGVFNVLTSERSYEEDSKVAGLGTMVQKPEGTNITFDDPIMGNTVRYTHNSFGLGFRVTREMYDDDLYSIMNGMSRELGRSAAYKIEIDAWSILNNAFSSSFTGEDGVSLCNTGHRKLDGSGNLANKPSVDVDLSYTSYQAALDHFNTLVDDRGRPLVVNPALLVIDPTFKWIAKEILGSEYKPYTANNEINPLMGEISENGYLSCRYLTDADSWFVLSNKMVHDLTFFWRTRPEEGAADDFLSGDALFKVFARYSKGFLEWRGVYGSSGG